MGLHCTTVEQRVPARRRGLHVLGRARRDHRPQRRHRLGVHQPGPGRHRPLPRTRHRRRVGAGRPAAAADDPRRDHPRARGGRRTRSRCARPRTARSSATSPTSTATWPAGAASAPTGRRRVPRLDGADAVRAPPTRSSTSTPRPTGRASARRSSSFAVPAQNIVYADRDGHIGYQAPGLVPIRKSGNDGLQPQEGWRSENDWTGDYVPFEGLPNVLDPDEGFVVTANQAVIGPDYPYHLTDDWDQGYRSQRIRDLLERRIEDAGTLSVGGHGRDPARHPQPARRRCSCPTCSPSTCRAGTGQRASGSCAHWDFDQPADSAAGRVLQRRLAHPAGPDVPRRDARGRLAERRRPVDGRDGRAARRPDVGLVGRPGDRAEVETRDDILALAMTEARDQVTKLDAVLVDGWEWGHLHRLDLTEPTLGTSGVGPVEWLVNRGGWEVGGGPRRRRRLGEPGQRGVRRRLRAVHADGRLARRLRRLPVDQPHRRLRPPVQRPLHRPDRPLGPGRDAARGPSPATPWKVRPSTP